MAGYERQIAEAAEAICGALHRLDFRFLGESEQGASTWFTRGEHPRNIRIEVQRSELAPFVNVNLEWRNYSDRAAGTMRGSKTLQVDVRGGTADVHGAVEKAVLGCLLAFRDVIDGVGIAGPEALKKPRPVESTADSNVPDTDEDEIDAGLRELIDNDNAS